MLTAPFSWKERAPCVDKGVLYVPEYYFAHDASAFPGWSHFAHPQPVRVEFCSGNGAWIVDRAQRDPTSNWVAIEKRFDRVRKIWGARERAALSNLFIVSGEALTFLTHYAPPCSIAEAFINFPDPWPKRRGAKHRLMTQPFLDALARCLLPHGQVTFVTDDRVYFDATTCEVDQHTAFSTPLVRSEIADYGTSFFDGLWREKGRAIHYLIFERLA